MEEPTELAFDSKRWFVLIPYGKKYSRIDQIEFVEDNL